MPILTCLYQFIFGPLELLMELVFGIALSALHSYGAAIIPFSLLINLMLLPLYNRAELIQQNARDKESSMRCGIEHIRHTFKGDERYMMLNTYYRLSGYHPIHSLKSSLPLLLEIPFFIAAYHFLSNLDGLNGAVFGPLTDLGRPDSLLRLPWISINILPIIMTAINLVSSSIYSSGYSKREKIQLYGMALIFLVLLYWSPSGLVLYWTLNNLFSLGKNIVNRVKKGKKRHSENNTNSESQRTFSDYPRLFLSGCVIMTILTGVLVPSAVIRSSPEEFIILSDVHSPLWHVAYAFCLAAGFFMLWGCVFYFFANRSVRSISDILIWVSSCVAIVNYMFFGTGLGILSPELQYESGLSFTDREFLINSEVVLFVSAALLVVWLKKQKALKIVYTIMGIAIMAMSLFNCVDIAASMPSIKQLVQEQSGGEAQFTLSRNGKNVVVLVMDKAISSFFPHILKEKPELQMQFEGFTWYPNTLSFGNYTNVGSPALYGGYEYTPEEINKRANDSLAVKHDEALRLMPVVFDEAGYEVTVCDSPYGSYNWISDLSIFEDHPNINAYNTATDQSIDLKKKEMDGESKEHIWKRNFFCYSIMKICPLVLQPTLYQNGMYNDANGERMLLNNDQIRTDKSHSRGVRRDFINAYEALCSLEDMTIVTNETEDTFLSFYNCTAHAPMLLSEPDYVPAMDVDNSEYDSTNADRFSIDGEEINVTTEWRMAHYHVNMAMMLKLGEWLDYLRREGVYDNSRIIIVADHGKNLGCLDSMLFGTEYYEDAMWYNPLLLVKDFYSTESSVNTTFMTNADTPNLAFQNLILSPTNPATGTMVDDHAKYDDVVHVLFTEDFEVRDNNGNTFLPGKWYALKNQNVLDAKNWSFISEGIMP